MESPAIAVSKLAKQYAQLKALNFVSFEVLQGELFALAGPHGSGKTTLCNLLSGISKPTSGSVSIFGKDALEQRREVGYLTQHFSLYTELSVEENMRFAAEVRGVSEKQFREGRDRYLSLVGLERFRDRQAGRLSGGMKQKLALCCALVGAPPILVLDEPTTGLDPLSRREFWHLLSTIAEQGTTTIVATPQFEEAELCQRVALIYDGVIATIGRPTDLRAALNASCIQLATDDLASVELFMNEAINDGFGIVDTQLYGDRLEILTSDAVATRSFIDKKFKERGWSFSLDLNEPTVEHVFLTSLKKQGIVGKAAPRIAANRLIPNKTAAIEAKNLTKTFGKFRAVDNLSLAIDYGEIYGLLGANGAGKTTTIQMLSGLTSPSSGTYTIAGLLSGSSFAEHRQKLGYMSQKFTLYDDLTVKENIDFYAAAYSIAPSARANRVTWVLEVCNLEDSTNVLVKALPQGVRQWLAFATAIMHEPEIVILDEPTAGLDPFARRQLWNLIRQIANNGAAILVTTHFLNDAEYCNRLGLMVDGSLIIEGTPRELKNKESSVLQLRVPDVQAAFKALAPVLDVSLMSCFPGRLHVQATTKEELVRKFANVLDSAKIETENIVPVPASLEDAFVSLIHAARKQP